MSSSGITPMFNTLMKPKKDAIQENFIHGGMQFQDVIPCCKTQACTQKCVIMVDFVNKKEYNQKLPEFRL